MSEEEKVIETTEINTDAPIVESAEEETAPSELCHHQKKRLKSKKKSLKMKSNQNQHLKNYRLKIFMGEFQDQLVFTILSQNVGKLHVGNHLIQHQNL